MKITTNATLAVQDSANASKARSSRNLSRRRQLKHNLMPTMALLDLPEDVLRQVGLHLPAPEILTFLSTHRRFHSSLGQSKAFWKLLLASGDGSSSVSGTIVDADGENNTSGDDAQSLRKKYLLKAYVSHLPACRWYQLTYNDYRQGVSSREGHLACVLGSQQNRKICINGGFTDDNAVYVLHAPVSDETFDCTVQQPQQRQTPWSWQRLTPTMGDGLVGFAYGSTLTPINATTAIRFGGFRAGGYSHETDQVAILTVREDTGEGTETRTECRANWQVVTTTNPRFGALSRAYHAATLVGDRYLVIIGGMKTTRSILNPSILDTQTWTWIDCNIVFSDDEPSGRHGHSVVLDSKRDRLVMFGGGSGDNLLRSGVDNSEVWELKMGKEWRTDLEASMPWEWREIHTDVVSGGGQREGSDEEEHTNANVCTESQEDANMVDSQSLDLGECSRLSRAEALCLGRCHHAVHVSPDSVLFVFGSGRPSTNGILAYNLRADSFVRPIVQGPLPKPRHSGVACFLEPEGYVFLHGGYTMEEGDAIDDMNILDLAPMSKQRRTFDSLPVDTEYVSFRKITSDDAMGDSYTSGSHGGYSEGLLLSALTQALQGAGGGEGGGDMNMFIRNLIETGQIRVMRQGEDSDDAMDSDSQLDDDEG